VGSLEKLGVSIVHADHEAALEDEDDDENEYDLRVPSRFT
jgi:hypothetical protein